MTFDLRKFLTSVCNFFKIAFVCCINNISPLRDSFCIPSKSFFVFNATPFGIGHVNVSLIPSSLVSLSFFSSYVFIQFFFKITNFV